MPRTPAPNRPSTACMIAPLAIAPLAIAAAATLLAVTAQADEMHDHGKHVHGEVALNVAVEGGTLTVEIDTPAAQVLGFEKSPRNEAERAAVTSAEAWFRSGREMVGVPTAAACRLASVDFTAPKLGSGHADYRARYRFTCANPAALDWFEPRVLRRLKDVEKAEANVIGPGVQRQETLTAPDRRVPLR
jgi:hypothetical protein